MKIQIALLTGMIALSTTVSAFACGGSGGYRGGGYSNSGYQVSGYGYARPTYQPSYHVAPAASWRTPSPAVPPAPAMPSAPQAAPSVSHDPVAPPAPSTVRRPIAVPSAETTVQTTTPKKSTGSIRSLTSEETIALLKLLGPKELQ